MWGVWFCFQQFLNYCTGCSKSNWTKIIFRSQEDTALFTAGHQQSYSEEVQQFLELSSIVFNVYWVINGVVFPWNVSIILIKQPYNTGIAIIWHLDLYISSHAVSTIWPFRYMKNTTNTITISQPRHPVPNLSLCFVHHRDVPPPFFTITNSALWIPPWQKYVLITRYVEARKINTDCSCRHWKQTD